MSHTILVAFLVFWMAASFLPGSRLWGINHLAFYPWGVRAAAFVVVLAFFVPRVKRAVLGGIDRLSASLGSGRHRVVAASSLSVTAFVLFTVFESSTQLLGDGLYVTNNIERASTVDAETFKKVLNDPDPVYPGTERVNYLASRFASHVLHVPPMSAVKMLNALLGAVLVFFVVWGCRVSRSAPSAVGVLLVALALLSGGMQIFFGYVEAYAPLMFFAGLYLVTSHRTLSRGTGLTGPLVCAVGAVTMHLLGLILLPSAIFLVLWVLFRRRRPARVLYGALALAIASLAAPFAAARTSDLKQFILPLTARDHAYAVFSAAHLADAANEVLLLVPGALVLGGIALLGAADEFRSLRRIRDARSEALLPEQSETTDHEFVARFVFALMLFIPCVLLLLFFRPDLGMARDWDLFAVTSVGLYAVVLASVGSGSPQNAASAVLRAVFPLLLGLTVVMTGAWVGINANPERSVARYEAILTYDRTNAGYAYETLAEFYQGKKDVKGEIRALENAVEASPNPRYLFTLGLRYYYVGEKDEAVATLERCLRMKPNHDRARQSLVQMLYFTERYDDVVRVCEEGSRLAPSEGYYPFFAGKAYLKMGRFAEARGAFDACWRLNPPPEVAEEINALLRTIPAVEPRGGPVKDTAGEEDR